MSTNQTQHLHLSQWEPDDEILRADFNADNEKIDAALAALETVADAAYTTQRKPYVAGTYTGNGAESRFISLGFTPSAVLVMKNDGSTMLSFSNGSCRYGGLAIREQRCAAVEITEGGFQVFFTSNHVLLSNESNVIYLYLALK